MLGFLLVPEGYIWFYCLLFKIWLKGEHNYFYFFFSLTSLLLTPSLTLNEWTKIGISNIGFNIQEQILELKMSLLTYIDRVL